MTTSFAYHPAPVMTSHFESYSNDTYPDYLAATTNSYPATTAFGDVIFTPLTTDSLSINPFHEVTSATEQAFFAQATASDLAYSPPKSHGDNLVPPQLSSSSESGASGNSTSSTTSTLASPQLPPQYSMEPWAPASHGEMLFTTGVEAEINKISSGFVDPTVLNPFPSPLYGTYPDLTNMTVTPYNFDKPDSPAPSNPSISGRIKSPPSPFHAPGSSYSNPMGRRPSTSSALSRNSSQRSASFDVDEIEKGERGVCPIPDCGKSFKDLKTHMLTHQAERPEKCPIQSCEFHIKGFARKYDKNRHTLTHYKGTMVCGFCPGSGSSAEKSFNRADVFKRHLMSVHNVEQVPPNSRKKSPLTKKRLAVDANSEASGTCSTCSVRFANAQEFYEHLDDCVLRVVQQIEPSEDINERHLGTINEDKEVKSTLEKHNLPSTVDCLSMPELEEDDDEDESGDNEDNESSERDPRSGKGSIKIGSGKSGSSSATLGISRVTKSGARVGPKPGLTFSKGGVRLNAPAPTQNATGNGRKKRKHYPTSWGCSSDKMNTKKRVLCVYDGQRRLVKDDMMLDRTFEVRVPLPNNDVPMSLVESVGIPTTSGAPGSYITDLDFQTLKRADGIFSATADERGPWIPDNIYEAIDFKEE